MSLLFCSPPLPVLLPSTTGQGLQISAQLTRRDGQIYYDISFENGTQGVLDGFMIQFNKNTFGLAAGEALKVPQCLYSISYTSNLLVSVSWTELDVFL